MRAALVIAIVCASAACKKAPAGERSCDQVGVKFLALMQARLTTTAELTADEREGVSGLLMPMRDSLVRACREDGWSAAARACYADAPDQPGYVACDAQLTWQQRQLRAWMAAGGTVAQLFAPSRSTATPIAW
jgi:hypothetical protein